MNELHINHSTSRDYDKDPIVIIDRMPEISFWTLVIFFFIALLMVFSFIPIANDLDWKYAILYFIGMHGTFFIFLKNKITKIRTISLYNEKIIRKWDDEFLELYWQNIISVKKSFLDFYDNRQKALVLYKPIYFLLTPISVLLQHPTLIIIKFIYKVLNRFSNIGIFDTLVLFSSDENMIAIFISTNELKSELKEYFILKGYEINNLTMFYTNMYSPDEITYYLNKKDN